ncbi:MAG: fucose isomerase, partial [Lachnospiraceae bacterium]|nr:fucose isomerase [Lachnospiraceae bacterium]
MKKELIIGFVVTLSGRWPRELPERRWKEYGDWAEEQLEDAKIVRFDRILSAKTDLQECISFFRKNEVDLILQLYGAFTGDDICCGLADGLNVPMILWAPREEAWVREDRLYANALCSAAMNGASLMRIGIHRHIIYGNKEEPRVKEELSSIIGAHRLVKNMRGLTYGLFGYRPTAFYNCAFDEVVIRKVFGINMEETDLKVVFDRMGCLDEEAVKKEMAYVET